MLLVTDGVAYTSEQQFAPMLRHAQQIASRFGLAFAVSDISAARQLTPERLRGWHAVGLKLAFSTPAADAEALARHLFGAARQAGVRSLVFDGDDDQGVLWPGVIEVADAYIKKHRFSRSYAYEAGMVGKSNLTDYVHRTFGVSFSDNIIATSGGLTQPQIDKIVLGWNIAFDDKIHELAHDIPTAATRGPRDIDILCRASVPPEIWTFGMRDAARQAVAALQHRYVVHAPANRVSQGEYYNEMLRARISVSPFGFGELCWRDFEAILCGSLLVKPDMSHVTTSPDLFAAHETYVPVAWDYSDVETACAPYLADEAARTRITATARERLLAALSPAGFLDRFEATMRAAGVL